MRTVICWPGLKPSARFHSRGSIRTPSLLAGIAARRQREPPPGRGARSPCSVKKSFGNGSMQAPPPIGSQRFPAACAGAAQASIPRTAASATANLRVIGAGL